jgi:hypothetical protein
VVGSAQPLLGKQLFCELDYVKQSGMTMLFCTDKLGDFGDELDLPIQNRRAVNYMKHAEPSR